MTGYRPSMYWIISWGVLAPLIMGVKQLTKLFRIKKRKTYFLSPTDDLHLLLLHLGAGQIRQNSVPDVRPCDRLSDELRLDDLDSRIRHLLSHEPEGESQGCKLKREYHALIFSNSSSQNL